MGTDIWEERFSQILLDVEEEDLLCKLVEAWRAIPKENRVYDFFAADTNQGLIIKHPTRNDFWIIAAVRNLETLEQHGLVRVRRGRGIGVVVPPEGMRFYEYIKKREGKPVQTVEAHITKYIEGEPFRDKYPTAYGKWVAANELLWSENAEKELTTIGHRCREAFQAFTESLVDRFNPADADPDKTHTVARLRSVIKRNRPKLGEATTAFLDSLVNYFGCVSDLVQRQEHDSQREGVELSWEDARRVVFQVAVVIYEVDRALTA